MGFKFLGFAALLTLLYACSGSEKAVEKPVGLEFANMDTTVRPQDDIFRYANGGWLDRTTIPPDKGAWSVGNEVYEQSIKVLLELLKTAGASAEYPEGTDQRKAADFYSIGMDSLLAEKVKGNVLKPTLEKIKAISNKSDLQSYLIDQELEGGGAFFGFYVLPDLKNAEKIAAYIGSGGLGLPERDYYLKPDTKSKETREKYKEHIANMLVLVGSTAADAKRSADRIMTLETDLAKATLTKEESREPMNVYHKKSLAELQSLTPSINWQSYFKALGVNEDTIIVNEPLFMKECEKIFSSNKLNDIKDYLTWKVVDAAAPFLSNDFVKESFAFNNNYLLGIEQLRPRWKRVLTQTDNYLGEAIGKLYVDKTFPPEAKKRAQEMVDNIKFAMADRIKNLDWMSDSTKQMALKKLSTFTVKIGYPDVWQSYAGLLIDKAPESMSYYQNIVNASKFAVQRQINKLGKPVDKGEWQLTPQTVDAYYNPLFNEIVFPAGILQPPFYNYKADEAINYGAIGAVIGHEISHGFDDSGSQFDAAGNLNNWWGEDDLKKFKDKGKALAAQYSKYEPLPGVFVSGEYTLGENIGDLGGVSLAYEGLQRHLREHESPGLIDGFTPEQRFFLSWATVWRAKYKDETLRTQINTDPHSPNIYRAIGPLVNIDKFYEAFDVKPTDKLYKPSEERVRIW